MSRYLGKVSQTCYVYPRATITQTHSFQPDNNISYRVFEQGAIELTLPRVSSINISKTYGSDAATCDIQVYDPNNQLHPLGLDVDWGNTTYPALVPNTLIKTYQGYGASLQKTGTWIIDEVNFNNPPDTITISCRDLGKLLIEQTMYPPIIPDEFYPIGFCSTSDKTSNETYKNTSRWIPYTDLSDVIKCLFRIAGFDSWNIETTGIMITLEEMSHMMLIDIISRVKEIVGYQLYFDVNGIPHFEQAPGSGGILPTSSYAITQGAELINISRTIRDANARSKILVHGRTVGGVGNINIIPPQNIQHVSYENRQILNKYCFNYFNPTQDWINFKGWVCGMPADAVDSSAAVNNWVPVARQGSGTNYYGMNCYNAVKNFQIANGIVTSSIVRSTHIEWGDEIQGKSGNYWTVNRYSPGGRTVGNFFGVTKNKWNSGNANVVTTTNEYIPGRTEIDFRPLELISDFVEPNHFLTPLRGQIRAAVHSDEAIENKEQCKKMANLIDFWSNMHNHTISLTVYGQTRYDVGHFVDLYEVATKTRTKVLITGVNSQMDILNGHWTIGLETFDADPAEPITFL